VALQASDNNVLVVAGGGSLPRILAKVLGGRGCVCAVEGFADLETLAIADAEIPLGMFNEMMEVGRAAAASKVLFTGSLTRPAADNWHLDEFAQDNLDLNALRLGDDAALRAISGLFKVGGFMTVGPLDIAPGMAMPRGELGRFSADSFQLDIAHGKSVASSLGALDVGQAVVVQQGLVLAVEGIEGTDSLIARAGALSRPGTPPILIKSAKPQQDLRLDVPTVGCATLYQLAEAGFGGLAVQAGKALVVDLKATIEAADAAGLFFYGF